MLDKKFGDRSPQKRRFALRLKIYGVLALFFLLALGIIWVVLYSPVFKVQKINVSTGDSTLFSGDKESFDANLIASAKSFILANSKIARYLGTDNILSWDNDLFINFGFSDKYPQVSGIVLKRDFTKREISIEAGKREKFGIWCFVREFEKKCYWFDQSGTIFSIAPEVEGDLIYRVDDYTGRGLGLGDKILIPGFFSNLAKIFKVMDSAYLKSRSFTLKDLGLEEIYTNPAVSSSPIIYFSLRNDPSFAAEFLKSVKKLGLDKSQYIDLRVENRVYYK
ncbi:MAG: hypothetical protein NTW60_01365 [Candidatus Wolfebacteria bacterium]|nr:hypothetical protein [Candidatus Wolfebacteria bacterium]